MQSTGQIGSVQSTSSDSELDIDDEKGSRKGIHPGKPAAVSRKQARRKRRGIVEKRRRDRINHSLAELRRLVPCASEKQGSMKLEKAEILQMTVDHLKVLHTSRGRGYMETPELATDYGVLGFRECLWEVARYLSVTEGLGRSDTPQSRLVSHLSTCASQREAATLESQRQRWSAGCARQAAMSRVRAGILAGLFPTVSCLRLEQFMRMSPLLPATGRALPMLTNTEPAPPLATATTTPFRLLPAAAATSQLQAVKIGQHLWATAVGAF